VLSGGRAKPSIALEADGLVLGHRLRYENQAAGTDYNTARNQEGAHKARNRSTEAGPFPLTPPGPTGKISAIKADAFCVD
jgi:hypothetical protein